MGADYVIAVHRPYNQAMQAVILSIGDELALGQTVDTNTAYLAAKLAELGIWTLYHQTLADEKALIAGAIVAATAQAELVLITGGLGPTKDDLTRQALAQAMGVELVEDAESLKAIEAFFVGRSKTITDANRVQALLPDGTQGIPNAKGTAPGIRAALGKAMVFVMPGVPFEMRAMYDTTVLPAITDKAGGGRTILTTKVNTFGLGESSVGQLIGDLMDRDRNPTVGTTVANGIVSVRIRSEFADADEAQSQLDVSIKEVQQRLGPVVFGRDDQTIASTLLDALRDRKLTIATAESCTGGLIGKMLTDVAGSSDVYAGGWVTYTNEMKQAMLGVPVEVIESHGAVSGQTVCAMAAGALERSGADIALSVSGVAGPGGGTPDKPVGTVWLGLASRINGGEPSVQAVMVKFPGGRPQVRTRAAMCALQMARLHLGNRPFTDIAWVMQTHPNT
jgi:competence/damage-inducible protein CinA-like protein